MIRCKLKGCDENADSLGYCQRHYDKYRYFRDRENRMERQKKYYHRTKEKRLIAEREWRKRNPDYFKKYYKENKERIYSQILNWRRRNPKKVKGYNKKYRG